MQHDFFIPFKNMGGVQNCNIAFIYQTITLSQLFRQCSFFLTIKMYQEEQSAHAQCLKWHNTLTYVSDAARYVYYFINSCNFFILVKLHDLNRYSSLKDSEISLLRNPITLSIRILNDAISQHEFLMIQFFQFFLEHKIKLTLSYSKFWASQFCLIEDCRVI